MKVHIQELKTKYDELNLSKDILENECTDLKININKLETDRKDTSIKLEEVTSRNNQLNQSLDNLNQVHSLF